MFTIKQNENSPAPKKKTNSSKRNRQRFLVHAGTALALLFLNAIAPAAHAIVGPPSPPPRGVYVYSWEVANTDCPPGFDSATCKVTDKARQLANALQVNGIDGLTLVMDWSVVEPRMYSYVWDASAVNPLDSWISFAASLGKDVNLAIRSGGGNLGTATPTWLFHEGHATPLTFNASAHQGQGHNCVTETIAAPWDIHFLGQWQTMLSSLATHLGNTPAVPFPHKELDYVRTIRLTGINRTTDEFRLPEELPATLTACGANPINSIETWLSLPSNLQKYSPESLMQGWQSLVNAFNGAFPGKYFNLPIIPNNTGSGDGSGVPQNPFPEITDTGCVYNPPITPAAVRAPCFIDSTNLHIDDNASLLAYASQVFSYRLTLEFESLNTSSAANAYTVGQTQQLQTGAAFMTNDWLGGQPGGGGAACTGGPGTGTRCQTAAEYLSLMQGGIYLPTVNNPTFRAQFLEVFYTDVLATDLVDKNGPPLACAIWQAHVDLTDYTPPVTTAAISGQRTGNGSYRGLVTVNFTATDFSTKGQPPACSPLTITTYSKVDDGPWRAGNSIYVGSPGAHFIAFQSTDTAGNWEPAQSIGIWVSGPVPVLTR